MNRRGVELATGTIITAALLLIVLIVLTAIFIRNVKAGAQFGACSEQGGRCLFDLVKEAGVKDALCKDFSGYETSVITSDCVNAVTKKKPGSCCLKAP
jgi:hypothetical protein